MRRVNGTYNLGCKYIRISKKFYEIKATIKRERDQTQNFGRKEWIRDIGEVVTSLHDIRPHCGQ